MSDSSELKKILEKNFSDLTESDFNIIKKQFKESEYQDFTDYHHKLHQAHFELSTSFNLSNGFKENIQNSIKSAIEFSGFDIGAIYIYDDGNMILNGSYGFTRENPFLLFSESFKRDIEVSVKQKKKYIGFASKLNPKDPAYKELSLICILPLVHKRKLLGTIVIGTYNQKEIIEHIVEGLISISSQIAGVVGYSLTIKDLKINEERLSFALKASHEGLWDYDLVNKVIYYSPRWYTLLGYLPDELPHSFKTWEKLCHKDDIELLKNKFHSSTNNNSFFVIEHRLKSKSGNFIWIRTNGIVVEKSSFGNPKRIIGTNLNIHGKKLIEDKLKTERDFNANLTETSPIGICVLDKEGNISYANKQATVILGLKKDAITSLTYNAPEWKITNFKGEPYADEELPFSIVKRTKKSIFNVEHAVKNKKGKKTYLSINSSPILENNEFNGTVVTIQNLTQQVLSEQKIKESETKFQLLFENLTSGFANHKLIVDENNKPVDYIFLDINPAYEKLTGLKREEVIGKTVKQVLPNIEEYWIEKYGHVAITGESLHYENYVKELDRYYETYTYSPEKGYFAVVFTEITSRKKAEFELKEREEHLKAIYKNITDALFIQLITPDGKRGNFIEVNEVACERLGYTREEFLSMKVGNIDDPESNVDNSEILKQLINGENVIFEQTHVTKEGKKIPVEIHAASFNYKGQKAIISLVRNVSERKLVEKELIKAKEKAEESDYLKTAFLANMSHEIRTPMNGIIGFASLLKNKNLDYEKREKFSDIIDSNANQLLRIITDIIDISKIESKQVQFYPKKVSLFAIVEELEIFYKNELTKHNKDHIALIIDVKEEDKKCLIDTDQIRLKQIFSNLINNAIKFTNEGSIIVGYECRKEYGLFYVKDTGIGIKKDKQRIIFDRFRQIEDSLTRNFGGTGLGLSICKGLLDLFGGKIWLESKENEGSAFYFTIPFSKIALQEKDQKLIPKNIENKWKDKTILIVEDVQSNVELIKAFIEKSKINILHAKDGKEAVQMANSNDAIDLILMDIQLPEMNGFDATKIIKNTNPNIPIIAQTAYAMSEDKEKAIEAGCDDFITKPIIRNSLIEKITHYLKN